MASSSSSSNEPMPKIVVGDYQIQIGDKAALWNEDYSGKDRSYNWHDCAVDEIKDMTGIAAKAVASVSCAYSPKNCN